MRLARSVIAFLVIGVGCGGGDKGPEDQDCLGGKCDDDLESKEFDDIHDGSVAGGGPLSANLAPAGHSVLLHEARGDSLCKLEYQVPAFNLLASDYRDMSTSYFVKHH